MYEVQLYVGGGLSQKEFRQLPQNVRTARPISSSHLTSARGLFTLKIRSKKSVPGQIAQLVEQRIENPRVGGSTPSLATIIFKRMLF